MKHNQIKQRLIDRINTISEIIKENDITSYDPFDALKSPYSSNVLLKKINLLSRIFIKSNNISPLNIRNLLKISKIQNDPKVLADLIQVEVIKKELGLIPTFDLCDLENRLIEKRVEVDNIIGWGLQFPYSSGYVNRANKPNLFTTSNAGFALLCLDDVSENKKTFNKINSYILHKLGVVEINANSIYMRYYIDLDVGVYNVNALFLKYLVEYVVKTNDFSKTALISKILNFLLRGQNSDGSWYYSNVKKGRWIDGFHTGYILESLVELYLKYKTKEILNSVKIGSYFFKNNLLRNNFPLYKYNAYYPVDSQNLAQAIQTRCYLYKIGLDDIESIFDMFDKIDKQLFESGTLIYQRRRLFKNKIQYFRWCHTPLLLAYANLLKLIND